MKSPLVSVVVPTYNGEKSIQAALDTVLAQDYRPIEVIVVDDGSTDATSEIIQKFQTTIAPPGPQNSDTTLQDGKFESGDYSSFSVRYFYQDNSGPSKARNAGIKLARGEFIAFLDSDDTWEPAKTSLQVKILVQYPEIDIIFTDAGVLRGDGNHPARESRVFANHNMLTRRFGADHLVEQTVSKLLRGNFVTTSSVLARRSCFSDRMMFNEERRHVEDWELWLKMAVRHNFGCIAETCVHKFEMGDGLSSNSDKMLTSEMEVLYRFVTENRERILSEMPENVLSGYLAARYRWAGYRLMLNGKNDIAHEYLKMSLSEACDLRTLAYMAGNFFVRMIKRFLAAG